MLCCAEQCQEKAVQRAWMSSQWEMKNTSKAQSGTLWSLWQATGRTFDTGAVACSLSQSIPGIPKQACNQPLHPVSWHSVILWSVFPSEHGCRGILASGQSCMRSSSCWGGARAAHFHGFRDSRGRQACLALAQCECACLWKKGNVNGLAFCSGESGREETSGWEEEIQCNCRAASKAKLKKIKVKTKLEKRKTKEGKPESSEILNTEPTLCLGNGLHGAGASSHILTSGLLISTSKTHSFLSALINSFSNTGCSYRQ